MHKTVGNSLYRRLTLLGALSLIVLTAVFAGAQGIVTGSISGTIEDASGALVSGAKISAKQIATDREYSTESTSTGNVSLRNLPPGAYDVRVQASGFRAYEGKGLVVAVGSDTSLGIVRLEVGSSTETVEVQGNAPLIEATTDQISATFDTQKTASLPVGNTFDSLALFLPGVATAGDASFSNNNGAEISVNGQRARSNNYQLDGQNNNDNSIGGPSIFFGNQDAISEVQVVTNFSAEYGRNMGGVVNYVTKSGTNAFHGTGFEFWQGNTFSSLENEEKSPVFRILRAGPGPDRDRLHCAGNAEVCRQPLWRHCRRPYHQGQAVVFRIRKLRTATFRGLAQFQRNRPGTHGQRCAGAAGRLPQQPCRSALFLDRTYGRHRWQPHFYPGPGRAGHESS